MKKILNGFIGGLFFVGIFSSAVFSAEIKKADELFEKGTFQEALKEYELVSKETGDTDIRWKAFFRECESLAHLFRYGEAAEKLLAIPIPGSFPHNARILILKTEMLRNFLLQYSSMQRTDVVDDAQGKDAFRLTPDGIKKEIGQSYRKLWDLRERLVGIDLREEAYFIDIKNVDFGMYPTLFDYLVFSWTDYLLDSQAPGQKQMPRAELLLAEAYNLIEDRDVDAGESAVVSAATLMEEASRFHKNKRQEAAERWKIRRLLLPLTYSNFFDFRDLSGQTDKYDAEDLKSYQERAKDILISWMDKFITAQARAEAGVQAAQISSSLEKFAEAVELCITIEKKFSGTRGARRAQFLRSQIEMPVLSLQVKTVLPPGKDALSLATKNIKKVYFRLYNINADAVKKELEDYRARQYRQSYDYFEGWSGIFNLNWSYQDWGKNWLKSYLSQKNPDQQWSVDTGDKGDYAHITQTMSPPELEKGIYLVLACGDSSFSIGSSMLSVCFLNITDFVLVGTAGFTPKTRQAYYDYVAGFAEANIEDSGFHFYALDALEGKPIDAAQLDVAVYLSNKSRRKTFNLTTDNQGLASLSLPVNVIPYANNHYNADPLAKSKDAYSYWSQSQYLYYYPISPIELFIETDRPIYRPLDTVQAKVVVVRRSAQGFKSIGAGGQVINITVSDPNRKEFFTKSVELNEFGSAGVTFQIPQGRLLGRYSLSANCNDGRFNNSASVYFSVEEYKRPEFEIKLKKAETAWKYGRPVEIKGKAAYYFGGPVADASISYRIKRRVYIPYCFRYWFGENFSFGGEGEEVADGKIKADSSGEFVITFIPQAGAQTYGGNIPDIAEFTVEVDGRDSGGRTISGRESYKAGKAPFYFDVKAQKGFYLEDENVRIDAKRLTINDAPAPGSGTYEVFTLADLPAKKLSDLGYGYYGYWGWMPPLDLQLKDVANDKLVLSAEVTYDEEGKAVIALAPLSQGAYRMILKSKDEQSEEVTQAKIFIVAKNLKEPVPINAACVTIAQDDERKPSDTARFVIGSSLASGTYYIELWAGTFLLERRLLEGRQKVRLIEVPVTGKMKGGFTLRWFGVKDFAVYGGEAAVSVPWSEKKLKLSLEPFNKELQPGKEVEWGIKVLDSQDEPVISEALGLMYDRSLEYYATSDNRWLDILYEATGRPTPGTYSALMHHAQQMPITEGLLQNIMELFRQPPQEMAPPGLRVWRTWAGGRHYRHKGFNNALFDSKSRGMDADYMMGEAGVAVPMATAQEAVLMEKDEAKISKFDIADKEQGRAQALEVQTRKAFADTAFFKPHIVTNKDGKGLFSFTAPEQLTSWKIKLFAFTDDIKEGTLTEEAVTKKDLMVRLDLPRFFREKDKGTITAIAHNESDKPLEGELSIEVKESDKVINEKIKLVDTGKSFKIEPHSLAAFNWAIEIPEGISTYKVRATVMAEKLSDAEERELPILPSRERLIESSFTVITGNENKTLEIKLKDDPTRINESSVLQIDPQLFLSILNTIPFLVEYPHECVEQVLNKYVPLSIINEVYKKYPDVQRAVSKIPDRTTVTPAWEKDDPNRLIKLMETPWVWESEGRPTILPVIDMLDPKVVATQKEASFNKLQNAQLSNGAFPWWPGGEADPYMTLYVLSGLAEARRYGVEVPREMVQKALAYVNKEIPLRLKPEERDLSLISFAAYVVTSYSPNEFPEAKKGHEAAGAWVKYLEENIHALTPFGKAYLAYTYLHLGNKERAAQVLDMAMDGVREDPLTGVYWTPEKYSWVWYSDSVEKHAFFLRTLQEVRPDDKRIPGMVQWLLFNRKGNVWKSTKASVAAVYALLDYLNQRGALSADEILKVQWGASNYSEVVKADDWLDKPIRWQKRGFEITDGDSKVQITKEGPGLAFASLTRTYSTDQIPEASTPGMLELERKFYLRVKEGESYHLKPVSSGDTVSVGDQIEVQLKVNTRSQFEYMHLKDAKAAGFEAETLLSGWKYGDLRFYEEPRDSLTNFFISWLPHGEYILRYRLRPTKPGTYRIGASTLQSMYAPEMTAHSAGFIINVRDGSQAMKEVSP